MMIALSMKNKLGFINGFLSKPTGTDENLHSSWIRNNKVVISWILNSGSKEISASIIFSESAVEIWEDSKDRFQQSNGPRIFELRRALINLNQEQNSVRNYFTKLKTIWEELTNYRPVCTCGKCSCGGVKELNLHYQMEYAMSFLMGLNENFAQVRGQLLLMDPLPPINKVFSLISQEEKQRKVGSQSTPTTEMAFAMKSENSKKAVVSNSNNFNNRGNKPFNNNRPFCTHCKYHRHTVERCYKIHGYPPGFRQKQKPQNNFNHANAAVNQVSKQSDEREVANNAENGNFLQSLYHDQCQ